MNVDLSTLVKRLLAMLVRLIDVAAPLVWELFDGIAKLILAPLFIAGYLLVCTFPLLCIAAVLLVLARLL